MNDDSTIIGKQFFSALERICRTANITRVLETGTYKGTGSTLAVANALREISKRWMIDTVEINPVFREIAARNLKQFGAAIAVHQGLSLPSTMLPGLKTIDAFVRGQAALFPDIYIDHPLDQAAAMYHRESAWPFAAEDVIGEMLARKAQPDLIILDSAGHLGLIEFTYTIERLKKPCYVALDDVKHLKHAASCELASLDPRFDLIFRTYEKFGSAIYKFTP